MLREHVLTGTDTQQCVWFEGELPEMATHSWGAIQEALRSEWSAVYGAVSDPIMHMIRTSFVETGPIPLKFYTGLGVARSRGLRLHGLPSTGTEDPRLRDNDVDLTQIVRNTWALLSDWEFTSNGPDKPGFKRFCINEKPTSQITFKGEVVSGTHLLKDAFPEGVWIPPKEPFVSALRFIGQIVNPHKCIPMSYGESFPEVATYSLANRIKMHLSRGDELWHTGSPWCTGRVDDYSVDGDLVDGDFEGDGRNRPLEVTYTCESTYHHWSGERHKVSQYVGLRFSMPLTRAQYKDHHLGTDYFPEMETLELELGATIISAFNVDLRSIKPSVMLEIVVETTSVMVWDDEEDAWIDDVDSADLMGIKSTTIYGGATRAVFRRYPQSEVVDLFSPNQTGFGNLRSTPFRLQKADQSGPYEGLNHFISDWADRSSLVVRDCKGGTFVSAGIATDSLIKSLDMNSIENLSQLQSMSGLLDPVVLTLEFGELVWRRKWLDAGTKLVDVLASAKLVHDYGLAPTLSDAKEFVENAGPIIKAIVTSAYWGKPLVGYGKLVVPKSELDKFYPDLDLSVTIRTKVVARLDYHTLLGALLPAEAFGLLPSLSRFWDLRPYSFVVDWFTAAGSHMETIDQAIQALVLSPSGYVHTITCTSPITEEILNTFGCVGTSGNESVIQFYRWVKPNHPSPWPSRLNFQPPNGGPPDIGLGLAFVWSQLK